MEMEGGCARVSGRVVGAAARASGVKARAALARGSSAWRDRVSVMVGWLAWLVSEQAFKSCFLVSGGHLSSLAIHLFAPPRGPGPGPGPGLAR